MKYRYWYSFFCFHATPQVEDSPIDISCSTQIEERLPSDRINAQICKMMSLPPMMSLPLDKCSCHVSNGVGVTHDPHSASSQTLMIPCCHHQPWNSLTSFSVTSTAFIHAHHSVGTSSGAAADTTPLHCTLQQVVMSSPGTPSSLGENSPVDGIASVSSTMPAPLEPPEKHALIRPRGGTVTDWKQIQETDFSPLAVCLSAS